MYHYSIEATTECAEEHNNTYKVEAAGEAYRHNVFVLCNIDSSTYTTVFDVSYVCVSIRIPRLTGSSCCYRICDFTCCQYAGVINDGNDNNDDDIGR